MAGGMTRTYSRDGRSKTVIAKSWTAFLAFVFGCVITGTLFLSFTLVAERPNELIDASSMGMGTHVNKNEAVSSQTEKDTSFQTQSAVSPLHGIRILVAIASFDFSQLPHLEEVIDGYHDLCTTGAAKVDVVIHTTIPYPITLIDLLNTRLLPSCNEVFSLTIAVKSPSLRLHLVDCHRMMFYQRLNQYDLFIYTEDDIKVTPSVVVAYLQETARIERIVGKDRSSDFNVGVVRYEYNYPSNVVIDDKTRHATQNVTRVYWEHGQYPVFFKAVDMVPDKLLEKSHIYMKNHHQGMFLATRTLLEAWKVRKNCEFDKVRNRPGLKNRPSQPAEGTQRVWMSSQMLYGPGHCNVQQVLPIDSFGTLTLLHLPNKNYRRVGHFRNRTFADGSENFDTGVPGSLLTAMRLHLEVRKRLLQTPAQHYNGIRMVDECSCEFCEHSGDCSVLLAPRMKDFREYVERGGILTKDDMKKTDLV